MKRLKRKAVAVESSKAVHQKPPVIGPAIATDEALQGLEATRSDSSQAIDRVFEDKSSDFWASRTGFRQYLKKRPSGR